jgi:hypothetical protein
MSKQNSCSPHVLAIAAALGKPDIHDTRSDHNFCVHLLRFESTPRARPTPTATGPSHSAKSADLCARRSPGRQNRSLVRCSTLKSFRRSERTIKPPTWSSPPCLLFLRRKRPNSHHSRQRVLRKWNWLLRSAKRRQFIPPINIRLKSLWRIGIWLA